MGLTRDGSWSETSGDCGMLGITCGSEEDPEAECTC